ncbi:LORF2 protein, partial [Crocuta crocuta]
IENPQINLYIYGKLIFQKSAKRIQWGEDFLTNGIGATGYPYEKKLDPYFTSYTKINSKGIKDLNVSNETINLLEENIGVNLCDFGLDNGFLSMTAKAQTTQEKEA